jgi:hypothetical protein
MKWMEVIKVRSSGKGSPLLDELMMSMAQSNPRGMTDAKIYRNAALNTDWSMHLHWQSDGPKQNGSTLGIRMAHALKEFGLVDHSVWIEDNKSLSVKNSPPFAKGG